MKFKNHLRGGIAAGIGTTGFIYFNNDKFTKIINFLNDKIGSDFFSNDLSIYTLLILCMFIIGFSILNDLDSVYSKVGRILLPISYPMHILSYVLYMIFYQNSFYARKRAINNSINDNRFWLMKMLIPTSMKTYHELFKIVHRMVFHTEIGLIMFLGIAYFIDIKYFDFNNIYYLGIIIGYVTHLFLDWVHGKLPIPFLLRLIFIILRIRKEVYGLDLKIGG